MGVRTCYFAQPEKKKGFGLQIELRFKRKRKQVVTPQPHHQRNYNLCTNSYKNFMRVLCESVPPNFFTRLAIALLIPVTCY